MSKGRTRTATSYHDRLAVALTKASDSHGGRDLTKQDVWALFESSHGKLEQKDKDYLLASDHCDRTTPKAKKGTGRCSICVGGDFLLVRVSDKGHYRIRDNLAIAGIGASGQVHELESIAGTDQQPLVDVSRDYEEGRRLLRRHRVIERKAQLVTDKKSHFQRTHGHLFCEACSFDFATVYGSLGDGYAECHHTTPLAQLEGVRSSRVEDLAVVCANCHRMLHRPPFYSVDELKELVEARKKFSTH
jgi:hypothetical protein